MYLSIIELQMQAPTLLIRPLAANLTRDTETFGKMDPVVEISIGGKTYKTACHDNGGKNPQWQDVFSHVMSGEQGFTFNVVDIDTVSKSDPIGSGQVSLAETFQKRSTSNWYDIAFQGKPAGKVLISLEVMAPQGWNWGK